MNLHDVYLELLNIVDVWDEELPPEVSEELVDLAYRCKGELE